jgi:hypothetical protein
MGPTRYPQTSDAAVDARSQGGSDHWVVQGKAMSSGLVWITPPSKMNPAIRAYEQRLLFAVKTLAQYFAQKMQDEARRNARWEDRTGNARSGLYALCEEAAGDFVTIYLSHTMYYGVFLELCNGGKYAIILPTIQRNLPEIERQLKRLLA